jgi:site-specific recombinase XerD
MVRGRVARARPGSLVFTTKNGAAWHHPHFRSRAWEPAVDVANLARRPTPHWLRHTHVGWMVLAGASLPELQSRIGHASIKTTIDVYGRMVTDVSPVALDAFAAMRGQQPRTARELEG